MPGAAQDLALAGVLVVPGLVGFDQPGQDALAHRSALVRAAVEQPKELTVQIEHGDRTAAHRHEFPASRRDFRHRRDHVLAHPGTSHSLLEPKPYTGRALSRKTAPRSAVIHRRIGQHRWPRIERRMPCGQAWMAV